MKLAFFQLEDWEEKMIREKFPANDLYIDRNAINLEKLPDVNDAEVLAIFVNSRITKEVLERFPKLKLVTTRSTGFDHIDLEACKARGLTVCYVPGYGDNTVAEFTFGLILNLTRKMYWAIDHVKREKSLAFSVDALRGVDLKGKTLGIVGTGRIGKEVIKIAKGFGMNVVAHDMFPDAKFAEAVGYPYVTLEELLRQADVLTFHCPYTKDTHHIVNMENIKLVKRGAYLVNTARGGIVETAAMLLGLKEGILSGVGLDVFEEEIATRSDLALQGLSASAAEVVRENKELIEMPNVLMTPHNAFNSKEALERILETTLANIHAFQEGTPQNLVP
ncbi:MAG: NAD(P)-dependent oxidoreductase [Patescibacteria group bacterium]